jgi:uncharacterized membrane protein
VAGASRAYLVRCEAAKEVSWALLRWNAVEAPRIAAYLCSFAGILLALFTAWLGGELVTRFGIGVHAGADVDAPPMRHAHR